MSSKIYVLVQKSTYRIPPNYSTYHYKRTVKQFRSLQITASVLFIHLFIKAFFVGTHLNCIDNSINSNEYPNISFYKETQKKKPTKTSHKHH